jgi:hypothetical protein
MLLAMMKKGLPGMKIRQGKHTKGKLQTQDDSFSEATAMVLRRCNAFSSSEVDFQSGLQAAQAWRSHLLLKCGSLDAAWTFLLETHAGHSMDGNSEANKCLDLVDLQDILPSKMQMADLDADRMWVVLQLVEGRSTWDYRAFVSAMQFVRPLESLLDLRQRLVQWYKFMPAAVALLRQVHRSRLPEGRQLSITIAFEEFEAPLLYVAGVTDVAVRRMLTGLDSSGSLCLAWADLQFGLDNAAGYEQLGGLAASLHQEGDAAVPNLTAGLEAAAAMLADDPSGQSDLAVVDDTALARLGIPRTGTKAVLAVLQRGRGQQVAEVTFSELSRQLHASDGSSWQNNGRPTALELGNTSISVNWLSAVGAWRRLRPALLAHFPGGGVEAFKYLDMHETGTLGLAQWVRGVKATGLCDSEEEAAMLFGSLICWEHPRWSATATRERRINFEDLSRGLRLATPIASLEQLRDRLVDELRSLEEAFAVMSGKKDNSLDGGQTDANDSISFDDFAHALQRDLWMTRKEAANCFVLFEPLSDGQLSRSCFLRTLENPDAASRLRDLCVQIAKTHGINSRAFEGHSLTDMLDRRNFVNKVSELLVISSEDARLLYMYLVPNTDSHVQLADLLQAVTAMEQQHYRYLVPLQRSQVGAQSASAAAGATPHSSSRVSVRRSLLPRLATGRTSTASNQSGGRSASLPGTALGGNRRSGRGREATEGAKVPAEATPRPNTVPATASAPRPQVELPRFALPMMRGGATRLPTKAGSGSVSTAATVKTTVASAGAGPASLSDTGAKERTEEEQRQRRARQWERSPRLRALRESLDQNTASNTNGALEKVSACSATEACAALSRGQRLGHSTANRPTKQRQQATPNKLR